MDSTAAFLAAARLRPFMPHDQESLSSPRPSRTRVSGQPDPTAGIGRDYVRSELCFALHWFLGGSAVGLVIGGVAGQMWFGGIGLVIGAAVGAIVGLIFATVTYFMSSMI